MAGENLTSNKTLNKYFAPMGSVSEEALLEDMIIECIQIWGKELYYIPRTLVMKDDVLGEDRLSQFNYAYPIEVFFENVDSYDGQGALIQKFGLFLEHSATLTIARKRWEQLIGAKGNSILPNRPSEGDLLYFPMTKGLFEIKFVKHQDPFYQLGRLYVYKLEVEMFQYASEKFDTGVAAIDAYEEAFSFDETVNVDVGHPQDYGKNEIIETKSQDKVVPLNNIFGDPI